VISAEAFLSITKAKYWLCA